MSRAIPLTHLAELAMAERALAEDLAGRDAEWATAESALPGWTRAHVVGHLAGNAWGMHNLTQWASTGVTTPMYPSTEARADEIERRSRLPWPELRSDVTESAAKFSDALLGLSEPLAARAVKLGSGAPINVVDLASARIREIEIHRVDLAADYTPDQWTDGFTLRTLGEIVPFFAAKRDVPVQVLRAVDTGHCWIVGSQGPDLVGREANLLAWLLGRPHRALTTSDESDVPVAPAWV